MVLLVGPNYTLNLVGLPMIAILLTLRFSERHFGFACHLIALGSVDASNCGKKAADGARPKLLASMAG